MEDTATSTDKQLYLSAELWQLTAKFCVGTHELRTVTHVYKDLSSLQCVCKQTSGCAAGLWPSVAQLCEARPKQLAEHHRGNHPRPSAIMQHLKFLNSQVLNGQPVAAAGHKPTYDTNWNVIVGLPTEMLTVFLQVQTDKAARIKESTAKHQYFLTAEDLQTCQYSRKSRSYMKQVRQEAKLHADCGCVA